MRSRGRKGGALRDPESETRGTCQRREGGRKEKKRRECKKRGVLTPSMSLYVL